MRRAVWLSSRLIVILLAAPLAMAQTPPAPQPAAPTQPVPPAGKDYIIGPEDVLEIQVWGNKDLNETVFVRPDGRTLLAARGRDRRWRARRCSSSRTISLGVREDGQGRGGHRHRQGDQEPAGLLRRRVRQTRRDAAHARLDPAPGHLLIGRRCCPRRTPRRAFSSGASGRSPSTSTGWSQQGDLSQNPKLEPGDSVVVPSPTAVYVNGEVKARGGEIRGRPDDAEGPHPGWWAHSPRRRRSGATISAATQKRRAGSGSTSTSIMRSPDGNQDIRLHPNDIITVPQRRF